MLRKILVRGGILLAVFTLSLVLLFTGKAHTLLLDNKAGAFAGVPYEALASVTVVVDGKKPVSLRAGERDLVQVKGIGHRISVKAGDTEVTKRFSLPFEDMFLCSMPALVSGSGAWFVVKRLEPAVPVPDVNEETPSAGESLTF